MNKLMLFIDGSVINHLKIGYGAYLAMSDFGLSLDLLKKTIKVKRFEHTSSTKSELQTLLWALNEIKPKKINLVVYTDAQSIVNLLNRREKLEKNDYITKKGKFLSNFELYKEFYKLIDQFNCDFVKVSGHKSTNKKNNVDRIFTLVDKASRKATRTNNYISLTTKVSDIYALAYSKLNLCVLRRQKLEKPPCQLVGQK